ncbi:single-stranded DNA-binding protein [Weissella sagaensis]|uniref:single-stranded DNA-binding protein n=1 Tax=Weissella sagaensis TaxID=2559928 RepID=UPI001151F296|nr:single-stranded DNA-binding protein [Weissella sagaensis]QDJ58460.1 single-stranded DNA-binding protein [Weissella hellenica]
MINNVVLTGRLTKDMEVKYTNSGKAVASSSVAVQRQYSNANGEHESDFINFVIWGKSAENMANMTAKGSMIGLEGSMQTRSYENNQGQKVYVTEVNVRNFSLLESKEQTEQRKQGGQGNFSQGNNFNQPHGNFNQQQAQSQQQGGFNQQPQQGAYSPKQMFGTPENFESQLPF